MYNLRDMITNDGNPSGVVLPSDAYGIVVTTIIDNGSQEGSYWQFKNFRQLRI